MLGRWVRAERERRKWSQAELAEHAGVGQGYISKLELGQRSRPGGAVLLGLARAFGMNVDEMLRAAGLTQEGMPLELSQDTDAADQDLAELQSLWSYMTTLERHLLLTTLRERARKYTPHISS